MISIVENHISVLLIDDDEDDYLITNRIISKIPDSRFFLEWCSSFVEARELITSWASTLVLSY